MNLRKKGRIAFPEAPETEGAYGNSRGAPHRRSVSYPDKRHVGAAPCRCLGSRRYFPRRARRPCRRQTRTILRRSTFPKTHQPPSRADTVTARRQTMSTVATPAAAPVLQLPGVKYTWATLPLQAFTLTLPPKRRLCSRPTSGEFLVKRPSFSATLGMSSSAVPLPFAISVAFLSSLTLIFDFDRQRLFSSVRSHQGFQHGVFRGHISRLDSCFCVGYICMNT